ncbi:uncharacterized protein N7515_006926 [Penicillium bovifimosum]|uniref:Uncharacterized protein n=1 Tax=Penicillium bovifimosum TaxID=126998 RepID=A0A9W9GVM0_9EURO|nr:uncharacterized protein N7515_006926 [Penicillium bovifimosum]KAJ5130887.1 hypothetical protein N7515_006926 [Penicillium bovifimosum]
MSDHVGSGYSTPNMSNSQASSVEDLKADESHLTPVQRLKKRWREIQKKWGPLMAAKESWEDEYTFTPGRYSGQGRDQC